ncbi:MAG: hypothetical protein VW954_07270, partial [Alphaproteobacteria bacterium]
LNTDNYRKNKIFFWGPHELSQWFGRAILNKEIQLSIIKDDKIDDEISEINLNKSTDSSILTLKNNIEISQAAQLINKNSKILFCNLF